MMTDYENIASTLEATGDYKLLRRLRPGACVQTYNGTPARRAVILDVETTGLNPRGHDDSAPHEIIELALLPVDYTDDFRVVGVGPGYCSFREPANAIPEKIEKLTGITNDMVKGHSIDLDQVSQIVKSADWIIAHNARFDRGFAEILHPVAFRDKAWACSWSQIEWPDTGGTRLDALIHAAGLFHDGHRALDDCHALLELLARPLGPSGIPALAQLIKAADTPLVRLWAQGSPFEKKDLLKARGYRWNSGEGGGPKSWFIDIAEDAEAAELVFLREAIFNPNWIPQRRLITAVDRFSTRV